MCSNLFYSQSLRDWNFQQRSRNDALCQERSWNVAPLPPRHHVMRMLSVANFQNGRQAKEGNKKNKAILQ